MLHGEIKVNDFELLRWQADNVNNTHVTPVVYEVLVTGLDAGHHKFTYEFQMLAGNGYLEILTALLAEVNERRARDEALKVPRPPAASADIANPTALQ